MSDEVMIEQFHLCFYVSVGLPDSEVEAIHRIVNCRRFRKRLLQAVRRLFQRQIISRQVRVRLSR